MFQMQESMAANTSSLEAVFRANERTSASLEVMQVVLAGSLAFQILDRLTGGWSVLQTDWGEAWIKEPYVDPMGVWFAISMGLWLILGTLLIKFLAYLKAQAIGIIAFKGKIDQKLNMRAYNAFMGTRFIEDEDFELYLNERYRKLAWTEPPAWRWKGEPPDVEVTIDETNDYLVKYFLQYNKNKGSLYAHNLNEEFLLLLRENGLIPEIPVPRKPRPPAETEIKFEKTEEVDIDMDMPLKSLAFINREKTDDELDPFLASLKGTNKCDNAQAELEKRTEEAAAP